MICQLFIEDNIRKKEEKELRIVILSFMLKMKITRMIYCISGQNSEIISEIISETGIVYLSDKNYTNSFEIEYRFEIE